ncbi:MAG: NAD-binding protein [Polyangiaceae bacterium]|nr:NAD-binding protein [Polyangiaceae bacterium]
MLRSRIGRFVRIGIYAAVHFGRRLLPPILAVIAYMLVATLLLRWDMKRAGDAVADFSTTLYGVYRQLFFEPVENLPARPLGRAMVWITPLVGVILVAQGLVKVAATMFDPNSRREVWDTIMTDQMRGHIVVCGLGHVGYRVAEELRRLGEEIVGLESNAEGSFVEIVRSLGIPVYIGDARRDELLVKCGVARAKAIVCATSNDLANLEVALDAKRMNPDLRVVMRMFDQRLAGKVGGALELDESFSTSALSAPLIAIQATHERVLSAYRLGDQVRVLAESDIGPVFAGESVSTIEDKVPCRIVQRRRSTETGFSAVRGKDTLAARDVVIIDTAASALGEVRGKLSN